MAANNLPKVTFIEQNAPIDEYGRALYAVARSILRALLDSLTSEDLTDLNTPLNQVSMRQLAKVARLDRDKGMRGDGSSGRCMRRCLGKSHECWNLSLTPCGKRPNL
jgi:hypothetical protein